MSTRFSRNLYFAVMGKPVPRFKRKKARRGTARDEAYKDWIRSLRCCACGRGPRCEAAHVGHDGGKKQKCSDYATVPLCHVCHRTGPRSFHGLNGGARAFAAMWCLDFDALVERYNMAYCVVRGIKFSVFEQARAGAVAVSYPAVEESAPRVESKC